MKFFTLFFTALLVLNLALIESVEAQRGGDYYDRNPPPHRPGPGYGRPVPPPHRPGPGPGPGYGRPVPPPHRPGPGYGRPVPPPPYYPTPDYQAPARVSCSASDKGWEEHWGGHSSCGSCLQHHGNCIETCKEISEMCEVEGTDYYGRPAIFRAVGVDRYAAESEARRKCEWNRDMRYCRTISCSSQDRVISTRRCR